MEAIVTARIRALWAYRSWYRSHLGWIPQSQIDDRRELRYLIGLLREWYRTEAAAPDPIAQYKSFADWTEGEKAEAWGR